MDILFEAIGELLSELYGWIVNSERVSSPSGVSSFLPLAVPVITRIGGHPFSQSSSS